MNKQNKPVIGELSVDLVLVECEDCHLQFYCSEKEIKNRRCINCPHYHPEGKLKRASNIQNA